MTEHTNTPWHIAGKATIKSGKDRWIGSLHWHNRDANAAFIVKACNAHEALVKALQEALRQLEAYEMAASGESYNSLQINDALALALTSAGHATVGGEK